LELRKTANPGFLYGVSRLKLFASRWLPVLIWMAVIFTASNDRSSARHSSRLIEPLVRWLLPHAQDQTVRAVVYNVRKLAHVTEYAILAMLLWRVFAQSFPEPTRPRLWRTGVLVVFIAFVYAASDEIHQLFVPDREGNPVDVLIDTSGAILGLLVIWAWNRWRKPVELPAPKDSPQDSL